MNHVTLYPGMKPLPKPEKVKLKKIVPTGLITVADYNQQALKTAFKKR